MDDGQEHKISEERAVVDCSRPAIFADDMTRPNVTKRKNRKRGNRVFRTVESIGTKSDGSDAEDKRGRSAAQQADATINTRSSCGCSNWEEGESWSGADHKSDDEGVGVQCRRERWHCGRQEMREVLEALEPCEDAERSSEQEFRSFYRLLEVEETTKRIRTEVLQLGEHQEMYSAFQAALISLRGSTDAQHTAQANSSQGNKGVQSISPAVPVHANTPQINSTSEETPLPLHPRAQTPLLHSLKAKRTPATCRVLSWAAAATGFTGDNARGIWCPHAWKLLLLLLIVFVSRRLLLRRLK